VTYDTRKSKMMFCGSLAAYNETTPLMSEMIYRRLHRLILLLVDVLYTSLLGMNITLRSCHMVYDEEVLLPSPVVMF